MLRRNGVAKCEGLDAVRIENRTFDGAIAFQMEKAPGLGVAKASAQE